MYICIRVNTIHDTCLYHIYIYTYIYMPATIVFDHLESLGPVGAERLNMLCFKACRDYVPVINMEYYIIQGGRK